MGASNTIDNNSPKKSRVRRVLISSHGIFFLLFLVGVVLDLIFQVTIFSSPVMIPAGFLLLIFGTLLVFWANNSSHNFKNGIPSKENFYVGPYRYTRGPTHWGLFFLVMGFGFIANAFFVILFTIISFFIEKFYFQQKAEKILEAKYGSAYTEYKKMVKF